MRDQTRFKVPVVTHPFDVFRSPNDVFPEPYFMKKNCFETTFVYNKREPPDDFVVGIGFPHNSS